MTDDEINEIEKLVSEYNARHGDGTGDEISGALMFSYSIEEQIKILRKSKGRKIIVGCDPGVIDGAMITYK